MITKFFNFKYLVDELQLKYQMFDFNFTPINDLNLCQTPNFDIYSLDLNSWFFPNQANQVFLPVSLKASLI